MKPWFFWKLQGSKSINVDGQRVDVYWDMASAKYSHGPEPQDSFYVAIVSEGELVLLLGDMAKEAYKRTQTKPVSLDPTLLSRKEHMSGKKYYTTKAQFGEKGKIHDIMIECHTDGTREPRLYVRIDRQLMVHVKRLVWKFRGNQTIRVDGIAVEVFWDVYNWLFNPGIHGNAVFMFQTCLPSEDHKVWLRDATDCSSLMHWSSADKKQSTVENEAYGPAGFSLSLYAWKIE
ncbi:hypothetical protein O6H91_10G030200 [Diphasiastrum complanatum]|nr:hypothetical protein O6H91_10G030200 [Diphasiastrum complanatum]